MSRALGSWVPSNAGRVGVTVTIATGRMALLRFLVASGSSAPVRIEHGDGRASRIVGTLVDQFCRDSNCLSYKSYGTISLFLASGSWLSEGLFGWSFSVAWSIRHLNGHPGWGPSFSFGSSDA